jgi:cobalt-zinc-cadmium efflux system protein
MTAHDHNHDHHSFTFNQRFSIAVGLNLFYVVVEAYFAFSSNSLALLSDAAHNLADVVGMLIPWSAFWLAQKRPNPRRTYGFGRATVLASLASAVLLIITSGGIAWEAVDRFSDPVTPDPRIIIIVAGIGVLINGLTALMFLSGSRSDLNLKGAYFHMLSDTLVSVGVVLVGVGIMLTSWAWIDPLVSLCIAAIIIWGTWGLLKESVDLIMDAVPAGIDSGEVRSFIEGHSEVSEVHDLHIWAMSTTETALTAHVVVDNREQAGGLALQLAATLKVNYGIGHSTIQIEISTVACDDSIHP